MTLVERYGKPDLFLTMTCNPNWQEIKNEMKPHEEAQNRPDLLSRVFKSKLEHLQKEIVKNQLFGPIAAYTFVVEFQKRGLPHVHMLLILKKPFKLNTVGKIDAFISTEIPDKEKYPHLYAMVLKHMIHGPCGELDMTKVCRQKGKCRNNYPRSFSAETTIDADGYPIYRRQATGEQVQIRGHMLDNREAAISHGLLEDDKSNEKCIEEACSYRMPFSLRQLFSTILVYCAPMNPLELFFKFEDDMVEDYISVQKISKDAARQILLQTLNAELESMGKNLNHFQLSQLVTSDSTKKATPREVEDEMNIPILEDDLKSPDLLNHEQLIAYNDILDATFHKKPKCFFIDGPGGTGKTFLYRALLAAIRSQHQIALATASSGVAASILPNGRTAHSRFKIPVSCEGKLCCSILKQSGLATLFKETALIIWDKASMAKKESIEALDYLLRNLTNNDTLFGGKVVVLGGDFRQVLPVIPRGTRHDCINASVVKSYIWQSLIKFKLIQNMRARIDPAFSAYILRVGNGVEKENEGGEIKLPTSLVLQPTSTIPSLDQLIQFVFPSFHINTFNPLSLTDSAILTPKNEAVDEINEIMLSKFPGKEHTYLSFDETTDPNQQGLYIDFLNSITPPGMPCHYLRLKKNSPILLLRNINPSQGLCNGTRLICKEFTSHLITAQIAVGERKGTTVFIPRIPLRPNDIQHYPVPFTRRQFPVQMAPCILPLSNVNLTTSNYAVQVMVIEKNIPRMSTSSNSQYERIILQDKEGNKMQATIFGYNIRILQNTLKMYHTYCITNAAVGQTLEKFRFLENKYQLAINARTPVKEIQIDGLTLRTLRYYFTPISAISQVRVSDAKIGLTLATRNTSSFIFNPSIPEATALQSWCVVNASKIRELPTTPSQLLLANPTKESEDKITKIANLSVFIQKVEFLTVKGMARVIDFGQKFYYLACSICNKATNAYGDDNFWCNYCLQKVPALTE
ncbi:hypothetical protein RHGRI_007691 [Rhododendron griersonianum]|uniref:ATP-dependent DNA helicase n=1 Tax=Rhododendron griersonianum TaxID=479676 RepID=A0AAV6KZ48_9ERIC|nr:hypothetical protein RHGRI_007691 [Rhododendron griersonianum]